MRGCHSPKHRMLMRQCEVTKVLCMIYIHDATLGVFPAPSVRLIAVDWSLNDDSEPRIWVKDFPTIHVAMKEADDGM